MLLFKRFALFGDALEFKFKSRGPGMQLRQDRRRISSQQAAKMVDGHFKAQQQSLNLSAEQDQLATEGTFAPYSIQSVGSELVQSLRTQHTSSQMQSHHPGMSVNTRQSSIHMTLPPTTSINFAPAISPTPPHVARLHNKRMQRAIELDAVGAPTRTTVPSVKSSDDVQHKAHNYRPVSNLVPSSQSTSRVGPTHQVAHNNTRVARNLFQGPQADKKNLAELTLPRDRNKERWLDMPLKTEDSANRTHRSYFKVTAKESPCGLEETKTKQQTIGELHVCDPAAQMQFTSISDIPATMGEHRAHTPYLGSIQEPEAEAKDKFISTHKLLMMTASSIPALSNDADSQKQTQRSPFQDRFQTQFLQSSKEGVERERTHSKHHCDFKRKLGNLKEALSTIKTNLSTFKQSASSKQLATTTSRASIQSKHLTLTKGSDLKAPCASCKGVTTVGLDVQGHSRGTLINEDARSRSYANLPVCDSQRSCSTHSRIEGLYKNKTFCASPPKASFAVSAIKLVSRPEVPLDFSSLNDTRDGKTQSKVVLSIEDSLTRQYHESVESARNYQLSFRQKELTGKFVNPNRTITTKEQSPKTQVVDSERSGETIEDVHRRHLNSILLEEYSRKRIHQQPSNDTIKVSAPSQPAISVSSANLASPNPQTDHLVQDDHSLTHWKRCASSITLAMPGSDVAAQLQLAQSSRIRPTVASTSSLNMHACPSHQQMRIDKLKQSVELGRLDEFQSLPHLNNDSRNQTKMGNNNTDATDGSRHVDPKCYGSQMSCKHQRVLSEEKCHCCQGQRPETHLSVAHFRNNSTPTCSQKGQNQQKNQVDDSEWDRHGKCSRRGASDFQDSSRNFFATQLHPMSAASSTERTIVSTYTPQKHLNAEANPAYIRSVSSPMIVPAGKTLFDSLHDEQKESEIYIRCIENNPNEQESRSDEIGSDIAAARRNSRKPGQIVRKEKKQQVSESRGQTKVEAVNVDHDTYNQMRQLKKKLDEMQTAPQDLVQQLELAKEANCKLKDRVGHLIQEKKELDHKLQLSSMENSVINQKNENLQDCLNRKESIVKDLETQIACLREKGREREEVLKLETVNLRSEIAQLQQLVKNLELSNIKLKQTQLKQEGTPQEARSDCLEARFLTELLKVIGADQSQSNCEQVLKKLKKQQLFVRKIMKLVSKVEGRKSESLGECHRWVKNLLTDFITLRKRVHDHQQFLASLDKTPLPPNSGQSVKQTKLRIAEDNCLSPIAVNQTSHFSIQMDSSGFLKPPNEAARTKGATGLYPSLQSSLERLPVSNNASLSAAIGNTCQSNHLRSSGRCKSRESNSQTAVPNRPKNGDPLCSLQTYESQPPIQIHSAYMSLESRTPAAHARPTKVKSSSSHTQHSQERHSSRRSGKNREGSQTRKSSKSRNRVVARVQSSPHISRTEDGFPVTIMTNNFQGLLSFPEPEGSHENLVQVTQSNQDRNSRRKSKRHQTRQKKQPLQGVSNATHSSMDKHSSIDSAQHICQVTQADRRTETEHGRGSQALKHRVAFSNNNKYFGSNPQRVQAEHGEERSRVSGAQGGGITPYSDAALEIAGKDYPTLHQQQKSSITAILGNSFQMSGQTSVHLQTAELNSRESSRNYQRDSSRGTRLRVMSHENLLREGTYGLSKGAQRHQEYDTIQPNGHETIQTSTLNQSSQLRQAVSMLNSSQPTENASMQFYQRQKTTTNDSNSQ